MSASQKSSKKASDSKSKLSRAWSLCDKCSCYFILETNQQPQHNCFNNLNELLAVSDANPEPCHFIAKNSNAYLNLVEHPKG
jgi:hypothetical protein